MIAIKNTWEEKSALYKQKSKVITRQGIVFINSFEVALRLGEDVKNIQWKAKYGRFRDIAKRWGKLYWFQEKDINRLMGV
ncbi:hypothetical protein Emin_0986 [Elusimicrobium minutum Pei191]|uniref:Uncharacterized protein n=1 Tax=Elusimicrobium minutum (strain Pei191) TaxID=445932 RepID=B2KDE3_ELUMP|nr:hypothetical protein Emin_0986 [Elusimicrobium minutum Pei191]